MHDELTEVDIKKMKEEIEQRVAMRAHLREEVQRAKDFGDLSENDEYHQARREKNKNDGRIRYLENMINTAVVIKADSKDGEVGLFDYVTLWDEDEEEERRIQLVTTLRQDATMGFVSKESPLAQAIMGHKVGDRVCVKVNDSYSYYVEIRKIEKGSDNEDLPISPY